MAERRGDVSMFGTGGGFASSAGIGQSETTPQLGGEAPTPQGAATNPMIPVPNARKGGAAASAGDCYYFLQGTCTKVGVWLHVFSCYDTAGVCWCVPAGARLL